MSEFQRLFSPIKFGALEIRNRIVMSPMTTDFATHDGVITDRMIEYYAARAAGGVGLIITEDTSIGPRYSHNTLKIDDDSLIPGWQKLVARVHEAGAKIMPQLMHPVFNARSHINDGEQPVAASPIASRLTREVPRELSVEEIRGLVARITEDALRAQKVGCDGVFLHCAHKHHLLGSFLSALSNKRTDEYGGDIHGRVKLTLDVIRSIRAATGPDFPILIRISGAELEPGGRTIEETQYIAPMLVEAGVDGIQMSVGSLDDRPYRTTPPMGTPFGPNRDYAHAIKQVVDVPVICGTRITSPQVAEYILATGKADAVGIGRALIADPDFANKAASGKQEDIIPCWGCLHCLVKTIVSKDGIECSSNPRVGREKQSVLVMASTPKRVLIAGGGAAGLEAARVAALRGHEVTLMEKGTKLGGQLQPAAVAPLKQEMTVLIQHMVRQAVKAGVHIILNQEVTAQTITQHQPDVVVDATGGVPIMPANLPGINNANVVKAWDVLNGKVATGRNILVVGGGQVGCEVADFLAHPTNDMSAYGNSVTLLEMIDNVALQEKSSARSMLVQRLLDKGVNIITKAEVLGFEGDCVRYQVDGREALVSGIETIVVGIGTRPNTALSEALENTDVQLHKVGDVNKPRQAVQAIREGYDLACQI